MRDPELVARAQRAAARLESAWERWRTLHGLAETPAQPVVSYVGHALREPWGEPRVVIGISADEAEGLADFLASGVPDVQRPAADQAAGDPVARSGPGQPPAAPHPAPVSAGAAPADRATTGEMAELAGWASSELPGQASGRLASWTTGAHTAAADTPADRPTFAQ